MQNNKHSPMYYSDMVCLTILNHTLLNIFKKTENVSLVSQLDGRFHEDALRLQSFDAIFVYLFPDFKVSVHITEKQFG